MGIHASWHRSVSHLAGWAIGLGLTMGNAAQAQIGLSPLVIETEAARGRSQGTLTVSNTSENPVRVRMYAEPFTYEQDAGFTTLASDSSDLSPYLQFSPRELEIGPGEVRRVRMISLFPPSLTEQEYRAAIFAEPLTLTTDDNAGGLVFRTRIGATVYVRQGELTPSLAVLSAQLEPEPQQIQLLVENSGTASARPEIDWRLIQGDKTITQGQTAATSVITQQTRLVGLPIGAETMISPGQYQLTGTFTWLDAGNNQQQSFTVPMTIR